MKRIQRKRVRGWRMPENTVYVGRGSKFGNPYKVGLDGDNKECCEKYKRDFLAGHLDFTLDEMKERLLGKDLACWCSLEKDCHADILLKYLREFQA